MSILRRDFLKFSAGTMLATALTNIGSTEAVKLASPMEVERFSSELYWDAAKWGNSGDLYWDTRLLRFGSNVPVLHMKSHPLSTIVWKSPPGEELFVGRRYEKSLWLREFRIEGDVIER